MSLSGQWKNGIVHVKVGSVEHSLLPEHYIEWVSLHTKQGNQRKELHCRLTSFSRSLQINLRIILDGTARTWRSSEAQRNTKACKQNNRPAKEAAELIIGGLCFSVCLLISTHNHAITSSAFLEIVRRHVCVRLHLYRLIVISLICRRR